MEEPIKTARESIGIVSDLIKVAGDNPHAREAGTNLAQAALTIAKTINNALLPLAAINFAFDKARRYFSEHFQKDITEKTKSIPLEHLTEPKASLAGPALQGLAFTHEEPNLKDMYLSLLATAMDNRNLSIAHPAFVEIIKQLEGEEARLLQTILQTPNSLPIVQIHKTTSGQEGWSVLAMHLMDLRNKTMKEASENPDLPAMVDNWVRLGLVDVTYDHFLMDKNAYGWAEIRPEYLRLKAEHETENDKLSFLRGCISRNSFGQKFAAATGLLHGLIPAHATPPPTD